jgi:putative glutamine amidotransferase
VSKICRIGVTRWEDVPGEAVDRYWARVTDAGGEVVDLDESARGGVRELAPTLDGLMLTGGIDVDPAAYGAARHPKVKECDAERDAMELAYLLAALERDIPVLAICRGHQLLNVAFGGTLLQHIDSGEHRADYATPGYPSRWHDVTLLPDTRLRAVFGQTSFEINSRHHQAVRRADLAPGLRAVAFADEHGEALVEGMESEQHGWVVGVQWHPERLEEHKPAFHPLQRRLFEVFIARAKAGATATAAPAAQS